MKYVKTKTLASGFIKKKYSWDIILRISPEGTPAMPSHVDFVPKGFICYRALIYLTVPECGGEFYADEYILNTPYLKIFKADVPHGVTKIEKGKRKILLVSWLQPE